MITKQHIGFAFLILLTSLMTVSSVAVAQSSDDLEDEIQNRSERIEELEEEINQYEGELQSTRQEQNTLEEAVSELDSSVNRISSQVQSTQSSISQTQSEISRIESSIQELENQMANNRAAVAEMIKVMQQSGNQSFVETLLSADTMSEAWERADQLQRLQGEVAKQMDTLRESKESLESEQAAVRERQEELASLREEYADQQAIVESQRAERAELLELTSQEASQYQQLITERQRQKEQFEAELRQFEEQLNARASGANISSGDVRFAWPLDNIVITQLFGGTEFARRNPGVYGRPFHNGTDFGAPVGTPVKAVAAGTVRATGNTDAINGCYSYGKWVLMDHPGNVSTLYAHLSQVSSSPGETYAQGERIGYIGNTGYSTGPHLHLTAYVQQDVDVVRLGDVKTRTNCAAAEMPVAPLDSYLNPMEYLPST